MGWGMLVGAIILVGAVGALGPCDVAVVGGGWAGVYSAYRLAEFEGTVCLFEAREKTGGRTYSVEEDGLTIDIGAYRFGDDMHLPGDLIRSELGLATRCYQPDCGRDPEFNATLYKIVDSDAAENAAGYETPIAMMTAAIESRVRIFYGFALASVDDGAIDGGARLVFANGAAVEAAAVILNLPRKAITALHRAKADSPLFRFDAVAATLLADCVPCDRGEVFEQLKVYLIYEAPWWRTTLGKLEGSFKETNSTPPFVGRFHDGPMLRDDDGGLKGSAALETVYTFNVRDPSIRYYDQFRNGTQDPLTRSADARLLAESHAKLLALLASDFEKAGVDPATVAPPTTAILGFWDEGTNAYLTPPVSSNFRAMVGDVCPVETCLGDVDAHTYTMKVSNPTAGARRIFVANNDFYWTGYQGTPCCWAEQSLKMAELILKTHFGLAKPDWLDATYYHEKISKM